MEVSEGQTYIIDDWVMLNTLHQVWATTLPNLVSYNALFTGKSSDITIT